MNRGATRTRKRNTALTIKLRGKDDAPLSMPSLRQGLYDIARNLLRYEKYRVKGVTVCLTVVDEKGQEVVIKQSGTWTLYPYQAAADDYENAA